MALIKKQKTNLGIEAAYWKVGMITMDRLRQEGAYSLMLFYSPDAKDFVDCYTVSLNEMEDKTRYNEIFETFEGISYRCYEDAKKNVEFFLDAKNDTDYEKQRLKK